MSSALEPSWRMSMYRVIRRVFPCVPRTSRVEPDLGWNAFPRPRLLGLGVSRGAVIAGDDLVGVGAHREPLPGERVGEARGDDVIAVGDPEIRESRRLRFRRSAALGQVEGVALDDVG